MIEQLRQFLETSGMSQNKAADRMGVSRSALSGYLNGKYDGDIAGMDKKAALFLEQEIGRGGGVGGDAQAAAESEGAEQ